MAIYTRKFRGEGKFKTITDASNSAHIIEEALHIIGKENPNLRYETELVYRVLERGANEILEEKRALNGAISPRAKLALRMKKIQENKALMTSLLEIYKEGDVKGYFESCEENGVDGSKLLELKDLAFPEIPLTQRQKIKIELESLLSDCEARETQSIRKYLIETGVVRNDEDWNTANDIAHKEDWAKNAPYGYWKANPELRISDVFTTESVINEATDV